MHFSLFLSAGVGAGDARTIFIAAIAVLACLLGAEVAGICILISKWVRARRMKLERQNAEQTEENHFSGQFGAVALIAALPVATYTTLWVLAILTAAMAVVLVLLLIIVRACGYDVISSSAICEEVEDANEAEIEAEAETEADVEITDDVAAIFAEGSDPGELVADARDEGALSDDGDVAAMTELEEPSVASSSIR